MYSLREYLSTIRAELVPTPPIRSGAMDRLSGPVEAVAADTRFSGVVRVDRDGAAVWAKAFGAADRSYAIPNTVETGFAIASGTKGLTALTIVSLVEEGCFALETRARSLLGGDLRLVGDEVTIEHLLAQRSGIGDYMDEDVAADIDQPSLPVPVHQLATTGDYLRVLDGHAAKFAPGERFSYCNGGYVVLALLAERATGVAFERLVHERVCAPAGMHQTAFLRSDELPGGVARGYLAPDGLRTNALHLPVRGSGDGGIYTTVADIHSLWAAFFAGRIVSQAWMAEMVRPRSDAPEHSMRYGLGFWLHPWRDVVMLEGYDAGVSFRTVNDPTRRVVHTVVGNTSSGAWPLTRHLDDVLIA
jgi:CubicO group peptidase (beta-lactamase class C family)